MQEKHQAEVPVHSRTISIVLRLRYVWDVEEQETHMQTQK